MGPKLKATSARGEVHWAGASGQAWRSTLARPAAMRCPAVAAAVATAGPAGPLSARGLVAPAAGFSGRSRGNVWSRGGGGGGQ
jgi:hypothetical protein